MTILGELLYSFYFYYLFILNNNNMGHDINPSVKELRPEVSFDYVTYRILIISPNPPQRPLLSQVPSKTPSVGLV
jgi:hypothetical protein